jgi:tol-pal system protein YbgF
MTFRRLCVLILLASPPAFSVDKAVQELQRDVAALQDMVKQLQQSQDRQLTEIKLISQQALDAATKANTAVAVIQSGIQQSLRDLQDKVVTPVVSMNARMDGLSNELRTTQQAVSDLASGIQKLQAQMGDLVTSVKVMQAPPVPPPGQTGPGGAQQQSDTPTIPSDTLYGNANRDRMSGKFDLALDEFNQYLRWYGNTELAPNAQFYVAYIHFSQKDYLKALNEFDMVLEKYPENPKTPDAMYYKGLTLVGMERRSDATKEYREILSRYPNTDTANRACTQLKSLGMNCGVPRTTSSTPKKAAPQKK